MQFQLTNKAGSRKSPDRGRKGLFYRKTLIWLLLTASVPGMITGLCVYWFGVGQMEADLSALHQSQMEERVRNIDDQLSYLELDLSHWAFSPRFGYSLQDLDFVYNFQDTRDISKSLVVMQGSHPLIQDVEMYVNQQVPVVFKTEHYRIYDSSTIEDYQALLRDRRSIYWVQHTENNGVEENDAKQDNPVSSSATPLTLVHKVPGESSTPFGVLVVTLNRDKVVNLLKTMTPYNEGVTFLLNENGDTVLSDNPEEQELLDGLKARMQDKEQSAGAFLWEHRGKSYSVSYGQLKRIDKEWTYVSASPMTAITSPVVQLSQIIVAISCASLALALILSWFASLRMYSPIASLLGKLQPDHSARQAHMDEFQFIETLWSNTASESSELQSRLNDQQPMLRTGFLLQLLQGHLLPYSEDDLRERMERYGWEVNEHRFSFMHIRLTGMDSLEASLTENDESLFTFAASNIAEELAAGRFNQFHVMNFHDLSVGLFIIMPNHLEVAEPLQSLAEELTAAVNKLLKLQATITISRASDEVKRMTATFMELERAASFRQFVNQNQLIVIEHIEDAAVHEDVRYPFTLELEIIQALRSGDGAHAEELVAQFIGESLTGEGTELQVQQCMLQLLGSVQHMMLQAGVNPSKLFKGANAFEQLSQIREPDKMLRWMKRKIIGPFLLEREARASVQQKQVIDQTLSYISAHYRDDISLESCADQVGMSSYALSKLFKAVTGVNFIDYVTDLRIESAKELLRSTNLKINDVAVEVGYQQRYFNRIFKKQVGITPSEYRDAGG